MSTWAACPASATPAAATRSDPLLAIAPGVYVEALTGLTAGRDGKVRCPFHQDRSPSLHPAGATSSRCATSSRSASTSADHAHRGDHQRRQQNAATRRRSSLRRPGARRPGARHVHARRSRVVAGRGMLGVARRHPGPRRARRARGDRVRPPVRGTSSTPASRESVSCPVKHRAAGGRRASRSLRSGDPYRVARRRPIGGAYLRAVNHDPTGGTA